MLITFNKISTTIFLAFDNNRNVFPKAKKSWLNLRQQFGNGFAAIEYASIVVDYKQRFLSKVTLS